MAAKDCESVQEFPVASFDVPPKRETEEAVALSENVQDGHQSLGQSLQDPYTHAVSYLEKHHVVEILQVTMVTNNYVLRQQTVLSTVWPARLFTHI